MTSLEFRNAVATLYNLDLDVLQNAGVMPTHNHPRHGWEAMQANPLKWVLGLDDSRLEKLWALIVDGQ